MPFATDVKNDLSSIILGLNPIDFSKDPSRDFSRKRKLDFHSLISLILAMETGSIRDELLKYFHYDSDAISSSGFLQQRQKLSADVFPTILKELNRHYPYNLYKEKYQLLAVDGSSFTYTRCPQDTDAYFPPDGKTTRGYNQCHLVPTFDLLSKRYLDCIVQPIRKKNEFQALSMLIDSYEYQPEIVPIFIADRGFHALNVFAHAIEHNAFFLIRATDIKTSRLLAHDLPEDKETYDVRIKRILTKSASKRKRLHPESEHLYKRIDKEVAFDYISDENPEYAISLRVLRIKISDGCYENIITNLPENEFPAEEICRLYHLRWGIETSFRELKHVIGATNFHSKKKEFIILQLWARLLLYNFCSIITAKAVIDKEGRKHDCQVNYSAAYKACIYFLRLGREEDPIDIESLIRRNTLPIRPNRSYTRQHSFRAPVNFIYRFS